MNESSDGGEYIPDDDEEDGFSEDMMPSDMEFTESEPEYDEAWPLWVRRGEFASTRNSNTDVPEDESDRNYQQHIPTNDQEEVGPEVLGRFQAFLERFLAEEESYDDLSMHQSPRNYHPGHNHAGKSSLSKAWINRMLTISVCLFYVYVNKMKKQIPPFLVHSW